ncbi:MAG: hypothetical protein KatS3mg049_2084 [Caldilinea sp.]|nr:MAG: hypothetical protein KatS3mg049_2084 [Caldilinea sp.]
MCAHLATDRVSDPVPPVAANPAPTRAPTQPPAPVAPAPPPASGGSPGQVVLFIIENYSTYEILDIRNDGGAPLDIGGWRLDGSRGDDSCTIPGDTVLQPGEVYQVATGDSVPTGNGYKCGNKPIWNNQGETIYLHKADGSIVRQIETR